MLICVLGLGEIGLSTAKYIRNRDLKIFGYDINEDAVKKASQNGIDASSEWEKVPDAEVYIVCVSTWNTIGQHDLSHVFSISEKVSSRANKETLVSIESTILPGVSRKIYSSIFKEDVKLVHVLHRFWAEDPVNYGVGQPRVIGAVNQISLESGEKFYRDLLDIPLHKVSSIEESEMCKISENAYRYVLISFAEELKMICHDLKIDFKEVQEACNTKWNTEILDARDGIGGKCLPTDRHSLATLTKHRTLLEAAKKVDEQYREWVRRS